MNEHCACCAVKHVFPILHAFRNKAETLRLAFNHPQLNKKLL